MSEVFDYLEMARRRLIVAVDNQPNAETVYLLLRELGPHVGLFKFGLGLYTAPWQDCESWASKQDGRVMLDLKLHDIPNTVEEAVINISRDDLARITTVHASGGLEMLQYAARHQKDNFIIAAVTVLTSLDDEDAMRIFCAERYEAVMKLATLAVEAGCKSIVCSAHEVVDVKKKFPELTTIVPGIRLEDADVQDQKAIATPYGTIMNDADYLVVGRPILKASDRVAAATSIVEQMAQALQDKQAAQAG